MKRNHLVAILAAGALLFAVCAIIVNIKLVSGAYAYTPDDTVRIIFDTDMNSDVDDVGALAVLHSYIRKGRAELLAVVGSCKHILRVAGYSYRDITRLPG